MVHPAALGMIDERKSEGDDVAEEEEEKDKVEDKQRLSALKPILQKVICILCLHLRN